MERLDVPGTCANRMYTLPAPFASLFQSTQWLYAAGTVIFTPQTRRSRYGEVQKLAQGHEPARAGDSKPCSVAAEPPIAQHDLYFTWDLGPSLSEQGLDQLTPQVLFNLRKQKLRPRESK